MRLVVQPNMTPSAIVEVWEKTLNVFTRHKVPIVNQPLETFMDNRQLISLLQELNFAVESSSTTCIEGG